jgi:hypothetical protein
MADRVQPIQPSAVETSMMTQASPRTQTIAIAVIRTMSGRVGPCFFGTRYEEKPAWPGVRTDGLAGSHQHDGKS